MPTLVNLFSGDHQAATIRLVDKEKPFPRKMRLKLYLQLGRLKTQVLENASTEKASTDRKGGNCKYGKEQYKSQSWKTQVRCISVASRQQF